MSESVWFEQVDTALLEKIRGIVRLKDVYDALIPVPVIVRKPDEDFKIETFPSVSIYNLYSYFDKDRITGYDGPQKISIDKYAPSITLEKAALPYNLYYQVDFWAQHYSDMNQMTKLWASYVGRDFNLGVLDESGKPRSSYALMTSPGFVKSDVLNGSVRVLHTAITYRIYVEVDENIRITEPVILTTHNIVTNNVDKEVKSGGKSS